MAKMLETREVLEIFSRIIDSYQGASKAKFLQNLDGDEFHLMLIAEFQKPGSVEQMREVSEENRRAVAYIASEIEKDEDISKREILAACETKGFKLAQELRRYYFRKNSAQTRQELNAN